MCVCVQHLCIPVTCVLTNVHDCPTKAHLLTHNSRINSFLASLSVQESSGLLLQWW